MSAIYKARDSHLQNRDVAVKEMNEQVIGLGERTQVLSAFRQEAEMLARLDHPGLVRVFDLFEENGRYYMIMELLLGRSLLNILESSPGGLPEERVLAWADQLCEVLTYLHKQQPMIIYRDMKPSNVMELASTTRIKVIDFGIARIYKPGKRKDTVTFGTEGYAAPEQFGSGQTDERSDIYTLGATLHQLLTGHDPASKLFSFPSVHSLKPGVSQEVNDAIAKAVAMKRDDRFASVVEMKVALLGSDSLNPPSSPASSSGTGQTRPPAVPAKPQVKRSPPPPKTQPKPAGVPLSLSPTRLDFGKAAKGQQPSRKVSVSAGAGASVCADQAWLEVQPARLSCDHADVQVTLHTELMSLGRKQWPVTPRGEGLLNRVTEIVLSIAMAHARFIVPVAKNYQGKVTVRGQGGDSQDVAVVASLAPQTIHTILGWAGVVCAMLLEALIGGLIIGAILGGYV
jgi:serine/threonine protein kinase